VTRTSLQPPQVSIGIRRGQKLVCFSLNEMDTAFAVIRLDETRSNSIPHIPCSVLHAAGYLHTIKRFWMGGQGGRCAGLTDICGVRSVLGNRINCCSQIAKAIKYTEA
jgi:hypothetical protein